MSRAIGLVACPLLCILALGLQGCASLLKSEPLLAYEAKVQESFAKLGACIDDYALHAVTGRQISLREYHNDVNSYDGLIVGSIYVHRIDEATSQLRVVTEFNTLNDTPNIDTDSILESCLEDRIITETVYDSLESDRSASAAVPTWRERYGATPQFFLTDEELEDFFESRDRHPSLLMIEAALRGDLGDLAIFWTDKYYSPDYYGIAARYLGFLPFTQINNVFERFSNDFFGIPVERTFDAAFDASENRYVLFCFGLGEDKLLDPAPTSRHVVTLLYQRRAIDTAFVDKGHTFLAHCSHGTYISGS